jgi:2-haloacid dehalogenase
MPESYGPRFITFDCYGTLIDFQIDRTMEEIFGERLPSESREPFFRSATAYRFDEVLGPYKPYRDVIANSTKRAAARHGIEYRDEDGQRLYEAVPTWGPHPDVPEALQSLARRYPLVILSNADDEYIGMSVEKLGAPFHAVFTAQQAGAYKPRFAAFEYMLYELGCSPEEILHVSSSPNYDLRSARDVGIAHTVLVDRDQEPPQPWLGYRRVEDLSGLIALTK